MSVPVTFQMIQQTYPYSPASDIYFGSRNVGSVHGFDRLPYVVLVTQEPEIDEAGMFRSCETAGFFVSSERLVQTLESLANLYPPI